MVDADDDDDEGCLGLHFHLNGLPLRGPVKAYPNGYKFNRSDVTLPGEPLGFTLLHAAAALKCSAPVISALLEVYSAAVTDALGRTPLAVAIDVSGLRVRQKEPRQENSRQENSWQENPRQKNSRQEN